MIETRNMVTIAPMARLIRNLANVALLPTPQALLDGPAAEERCHRPYPVAL